MQTYELKNKFLTVKVNSFGAELCSVISNETHIEYIWQADESIWARHAPNLFPIVGKLKNGAFTFQSRSYQLPQHGFARDNDFVCVEQSDNELVFELSSNNETLQVFPFVFRFQITYTLKGNSVDVNYFVFNPGSTDLFFSVGAHPAFNCPLEKIENFDDYELVFPGKHSLVINILNDGLTTANTKHINLAQNKLLVYRALFDNDAMVFMDKQIDEVRLVSQKSKHGVSLRSIDWPYFGIWTKKNSDKFICLEPWFGIADDEHADGDITKKKGIIKLETKKQFNCSFDISFF